MSYIDGPLPPDEAEIWPGYTWGEHRRMDALLKELEAEDPVVAKAAEGLQRAMDDAGITDDALRPVQICEFCYRPEGEPHELECRDSNDPSLWVKREALAYCYLDEGFAELHTTSVPMTDEEAVEYFSLVHFWFPKDPPKYITRKALGSEEFKMMPYMYEAEYEAVIPIVQSS